MLRNFKLLSDCNVLNMLELFAFFMGAVRTKCQRHEIDVVYVRRGRTQFTRLKRVPADTFALHSWSLLVFTAVTPP